MEDKTNQDMKNLVNPTNPFMKSALVARSPTRNVSTDSDTSATSVATTVVESTHSLDSVTKLVDDIEISRQVYSSDEWYLLSGAQKRKILKARLAAKKVYEAPRSGIPAKLTPASLEPRPGTSRQTMISTPSKSYKRNRAELSNASTPANKRAPKRQRGNDAPRNFRDIVTGIRMAIVHVEHPTTKLNEEQSAMIEGALHEAISNEQPSKTPHFQQFWYTDGHIKVVGEDEDSLSWLRDVLANHADLSAKLIKDELVRMTKIYFWVPGEPRLQPEQILKFIKKQNATLSEGDWIHRGTKEKPGGQTLTFSVDNVTAEKLRAKNTIFCGLRKVIVYIVSGEKKGDDEDEAMETVSKV